MSGETSDGVAMKKLGEVADPKAVSAEDWKKVLPPKTYAVTREADTEAPFTGTYDKFFEKFWAGCGWPAFYESVDKDMNITRIVDNSHGMKRTEVRCKKCDAHLGHVFDDGPADKTGERYCINSVSMVFEKKD